MRANYVLLSTMVLAACAGRARYRNELVGHGNGMVSTRVATAPAGTDLVAAPGAGGIQLPQGHYELAMRFDVPRAQVIDWKVVCPGIAVDGQTGETLDDYRARRLEELRRERDRERERVAAATSLVVGAVAPRVEASTRAGHANVHAQAHVDAHAAGVAAAHGVVSDVVELPPGDVGRGTLAATARVTTAGDGVCALQVTADDGDVRARFSVTRIRDLDAEQRMRTIAAREVAVQTRGELSLQLVARGADPAVRQRRLQAEAARASAEAAARFQARVQLEAKVRAQADARARAEAAAIYARQEYLAYLAGKCNAEPGRRARIADEERRRREARLMADAAIAQRRDQAALAARDQLRAQLLAFGAKPRPPKPPPREEHPGSPPFDGAEWVAGYWGWVGETWIWHDGGWSDPSVFGEAGGEIRIGVGVGSSRTYQTGTRDHRRDRVRDHRDDDDDPPPWRPSSSGSSGSSGSSTTRDHRDASRPSWTPADHDRAPRVRDHRDKDDDDDDKPRVRDHRRR